ncbi:MAG: hypothetical protein PWQ55_1457 [Chloroflexota bacterium]|nr:hypothetical protein [Chloroflexota bacterium]
MLLILSLSIGIQTLTAILAIKLIKTTGRFSAWAVIALAIVLMAIRRVFTLYNLLFRPEIIQPQYTNEIVALVTSALMLIGIILIFPVFNSIKETNQALERSNRSLRTLSDCNQIIVRIDDEEVLMLEICRTLVEKGGYDFVWVGWVEGEPARITKPAALYGDPDAVSTVESKPWQTENPSQYATRRALNTGEIVIVDPNSDLPENAEKLPENANGKRLAWIVIPIEINPKIHGAIHIYSHEEKAFGDEDEIRLLQELSNDLAFGVRSIRERKRRRIAEIERNKNQQKYGLLFNRMREGFALIERIPGEGDAAETLKLVEINPAFEVLTGFTHDQVVGKTVHESFPQLNETWQAIRRQAGEEQDLHIFEYSSEITGKTYLLNVNPIEENNHAVFFFDITQQKKSELQVLSSEIRMRRGLNNIPAMVTIFDAEKRVSFANRATLDFLQKRSVDMVGATIEKVWPQELSHVLQNSLDAAVVSRKNQNLEVDLDLPTHGRRIFTIQQMPLQDQDETFQEVMCILTDLTEQRETEERIKKQLDRLNALHKVDIAISGSLDLNLILDEILDQSCQQLNADAVRILTYNNHLRLLEYKTSRGLVHAYWENEQMSEVGLSMQIVRERKPAFVSDIASEKFLLTPDLKDEEIRAYFGMPITSKGMAKGVLEIFKREVFHPDQEWADFLEILAGQAAIAMDSIEQYENLLRLNDEVIQSYERTLEGWSNALDLRDEDTEGHTLRVTQMTLKLARDCGITDEEMVHIRRGALLHDIGKIGIPDRILHKPGSLTKEERRIIEQHPIYAFNLISPIKFLKPALDIPYCHHEKWDGSGYPRGLKGTQIPMPARIFAVVDVWDALRSDRTYRKAWSEEETLDYIRKETGTHFDPDIVKVFLENFSKY